MSSYKPPQFLWQQPMNVPLPITLLYGAFVVCVGFFTAGLVGLFVAILVAAVSFQFWSWATFRGTLMDYQQWQEGQTDGT